MTMIKPAIEGNTAIRQDFLPLCRPSISQQEKSEIISALESGWLSTGPRTKQFERNMAEYLGAKEVLAISSCTAGLHLALVASGISTSDEVITSPLTFIASANTILHARATPVLADVDPQTYNISISEIEKKITSKTKAIIAVHYAGQPCEMDQIMLLAKKHKLLVIEDAAHAIGTKYKNTLIGGGSERITVFSFYATKTMTTGEGGAIATDMEDTLKKARVLALHGITNDAWKRYSAAGSWFYEVVAPGFKYNMTDTQAALGICQLRRLEAFIEKREIICQKYDKAFSGLKELTTPYVMKDIRHSRYIYPILINSEFLKIDRDKFIQALRAENIGTSVHFIPVHLHPYYRDTFGYKRGAFPIVESIYDRIISLPLFPDMTDKDTNDVIEAVTRIIAYYRK